MNERKILTLALMLSSAILLLGKTDALAANKMPPPETFPWKVVAIKEHELKPAARSMLKLETVNVGDTLIALRASKVSGWLEILFCKSYSIYGHEEGSAVSYTDTLYAKSTKYKFVESIAGTPYAEQITKGYISEESFPRRIVISRPTYLYKKMWGAKGVEEVLLLTPKDSQYVAIHYTTTIKWLEVMDTTSSQIYYLKTADIKFGESIAGTALATERAKTYAKNKSLWKYLRTHSWPWIVLMLFMVFGWEHLLESLLLLFFAIPFGILPPLLAIELTEGEMTGLLLFLCITILILGVSAIIGSISSENKVIQIICGPIRTTFIPGLLGVLLLLMAAWVATWEIHHFWGGALVWLITTFAMFCTGAMLRTAWAYLMDKYITIAIVYLYVGIVTGIYMFNACEEACSIAAWLALIGLIPGGLVDSSKYDTWADGEKAKTLSESTVLTSSGKVLKKVKEDWGVGWKKRH